MKNITALAMAAVTAFSVLQTASGATTWRLANSDAGHERSSLTNAYNWVSTASNSDHSGAVGENLSPNEIYLIRGGYVANTLLGNTQDTVFKGKQLTIGQATESRGRVRHYSHGAARTTWDDWGANTGIIFRNGCYEAYAGKGAVSDIYGKVNVQSTQEDPFVLAFAYDNARMNWHGGFNCAQGKVLRVEGVNYSSTAHSAVGGAVLGLCGPLEGFLGTMSVSNATICVGSGTFPGSISLEGGGRLYVTNNVSDTFAVGDLLLSGATRFAVNVQLNEDHDTVLAGSIIVVTNHFASTGSTTVNVYGTDGITGVVSVAILTVPATEAIYPDQFRMTDGRFSVVTNAETGAKTLVSEIAPIVTQTVTDANIRDQGYPSSMTNETHWSDGKTPHAGAHYQVNKIGSANTYLRTEVAVNENYEFPGESLAIGGSCQLGIFTKSAYFKELRLSINSLVMIGNGVPYCTLSGRIVVPSESYTWICGYNSQHLDVAADIVGAARIVMDGSHASTSGRRAYTKFTGDNSRFFGTMTVGLNRDPEDIAALKFQVLEVSDAAKLGAPLPVFDARALVLKRLARLDAQGNVIFGDTTRGIFIGDDVGGPGGGGATATKGTSAEGQFRVGAAGETLTILTQLTLNGRLHKYGAGTLALGGPLKFGWPATDEPVATSNLLAVAEGFVKPLAADSFNGMEMTFAAGTGIKLDINPADADLRTYGLRNTKVETPFVAAAGAIPVTFDVPNGFEITSPVTLGVVTVPTDNVETVLGMLSISKPSLKNCKMIVDLVPNGDQTTIVATFKRIGTTILFK